MSRSKDDIQELIRKEFPKLTSERDLLLLLNEIYFCRHKSFLNEQDKQTPPIQLATLRYYKIPEFFGKRYRTFTIKKKSGKLRTIHAPADNLKIIQQCLNEIFQTYYEPGDDACGFIARRNITHGAEKHTGKWLVFNIDLKDFFDSVTFPRVKAVLSAPPFNLNGNREALAYTIACLCCHPEKVTRTDEAGNDVKKACDVLPQGAPTSPVLTNLVCKELDRHLHGLATRFRADYSRYADDITFSSDRNIFRKNGEFMQELTRIIKKNRDFKSIPPKHACGTNIIDRR